MPGDPFYTSTEWRAFRAGYLAAHPWCCVPGCPKKATQVDHVKSRRSGGAPLEPSNCQPFCWSHHSQKTARRDRPSMAQSRQEIIAGGCDASGRPLAPGHHWNVTRQS